MSRRLLARAAVVWLVAQLATAMIPPALLWSSTPDRASSVCACPHAPGAACPMHTTKASRAECVLRSASSHDPSFLVSLLGPLGLLTLPAAPCRTTVDSQVAHRADPLLDRPLVPEAPPPRPRVLV